MRAESVLPSVSSVRKKVSPTVSVKMFSEKPVVSGVSTGTSSVLFSAARAAAMSSSVALSAWETASSIAAPPKSPTSTAATSQM